MFVYYIRRCTDVKQQLAGSAYISGLDGARGFNLLPNTARAKEVLAVLSDAGCFLPEVLQLGPTSGPYDFQFAVDEGGLLRSRPRALPAHVGELHRRLLGSERPLPRRQAVHGLGARRAPALLDPAGP